MVELTLGCATALSERVSQANLIPRFEQVYGPFLEGEGLRLPSGRRHTHTKKPSQSASLIVTTLRIADGRGRLWV